MIVPLAVLAAAMALAFANGANDNFKGVATLHGSRRLSYRGALALATFTTLAGSLSAIVVATGLARRFSGKGLVPDEVAADPVFILAVAVGAAVAVLLATRLGFPISTTHALTGALLGSGLVMAGGASLSYSALTSSFAIPLLLSPLIALVLAAGVHAGLLRVVTRLETSGPTCLCAVGTAEPVAVPGAAGFLRLQGAPLVHVAAVEACERHGAERLLTVDPRSLLDGLHMVSAGAVGFARGLNDTPKIAGGASNGEARWKTIGAIAGAWTVTLPAAALMSALAALTLNVIR